MNFSKLEGILPVLPTPFAGEGEVDADGMRNVAEFCVESGASGLVFPGVASEYDHLSFDERTALLEVVCHVAEGKVPVICGGGKGTPEEIGSNLLIAKKLGVVAAMVLIPNRFSGDEAGATQFMLSVIDNAPGVDIVLQNAPTPIGAGLDSDVLLRIVAKSSAIKYVKEEALPSGPRITALKEGAPAHLRGVIGGGGARYLIDEMNRGALAAMPAAEITDLHVKMWNAHKAGDSASARTLYMRTLPLLVIQTIYRMRLTKYVLTRRGIFKNSIVRAPLPELDSFDESELATQLESLADVIEIAPVESASVV